MLARIGCLEKNHDCADEYPVGRSFLLKGSEVMPAVSTSAGLVTPRLIIRAFWLSLILILSISPVAMARDLVLGFVPEKCQLLTDVRQGELFADYLSQGLGQSVRVRVFTDERNLYHWMSRFREIDLAVFSSVYLHAHGRGHFLPLAEYIDSGTRHHGGGQVVGRNGLPGSVFVKVKQRLLDAGNILEATELLKTLRVEMFVATRQPGAGENRFSHGGGTTVAAAPPPIPSEKVSPAAAATVPEGDAVGADFRLLSPTDGGKTGPQPLLLFDSSARKIRTTLDGNAVRSGSGFRLGPLQDGTHQLVFTSPDFSAPVYISFDVDASPPSVSVDTPEPLVSASSILLSGQREPDARLRLLNDQQEDVAEVAFPDRTHWQAELKHLRQGKNPFVLEARDAYGNQVSLPLVVTRDSLAPELRITSPLEGGAYQGSPVLDFQTDAASTTILVDGQPVPSPEGRLPGLPDGSHLLEIRASDSAGNSTVASIRFRIDRQAPILTVEPFPEHLAETSLILQGTMDPESHLALALEPDLPEVRLMYPQPGRWQLRLDNLPEGSNTLKLRATDPAGNINQVQAVLQVDLTPPKLRIISPVRDAIFRTSPALNIDSDSPNLKVQLDGRTIEYQNGAKLPELSEGEHFLKVLAVDEAGNLSESGRKFLIDRSAPQLQLLSPPAGAIADANPRFSYAGDASDISLTLDGKSLQLVNGDPLGPLPDGEHRLVLSAVDSAGNRRVIESSFIVDTHAPTWSLQNGRGPGRRTDRVLQGGIEPGSKLYVEAPSLKLSDVEYPSEGTWRLSVDGLQPGDNLLQLRVVDAAGNQTVDHIKLILDDQPPTLEVVSPQEGFTYQSSPPLDFSAGEGDLRIRLDAEPVELVAGDLLPSLSDGDHVLLLQVVDAAGNESVKAVHFSIDSQPPALQVGPLPVALQQQDLQLVGQHEPGSRVLVSAKDGTPLCIVDPDSEEAWSCPLANLPEGPLTLTVTATDPAGNQSQLLLNTLVDRTPPRLTWKHPQPGTYAGIDRFDYVLNEGSLQIFIDGQLFSGDLQTPQLDLAAGPHQVDVVARDAAGNQTHKLIALTIDRQAPQVEIRQPDNLSNSSRPQLDFSVNDGQAEVFLDGAKLPMASGELLPTLEDGEHLLRVEARDDAGNLGFAERHFKVDTVKPSLEFDSVPGPQSSDVAIIEGSVAPKSELTALWDGRELDIERPARNRFLIRLAGLREGSNRLHLRVVGKNGLSSEKTVQIVRDSQPDHLELLSPESRTYAASRLELDYKTDSPPARVEVVVDGRVVEVGLDKQLGPLSDGVHQLVLRSWDPAGNLSEVTRSFSIDTTAPEFQVQLDPRPLSATAFTLRGTRESGAFVDLVAPPGVQVGVTGYPSEDSWEVRLDQLPEGEVPLLLSARDQHGNTSQQQISLMVDRTPPQLEVLSPRPGPGNDPQPRLQINGEGGALAVLLNGQPVLAEADQLGPLGDGSYILLVREQDRAGNQSQQRVTFQIDTQAPEVLIKSPAAGARTSAFPILDYKVSDGDVSILLDDKPVQVEAGSSLPQLTDGEHRLQVVATDDAGNKKSASVQFFVDSSAPEVVLLSPASGLTADNTPLLEYEVDRGEARVLVDDVVVDQRSGMSLAPLKEGEHLIRVEAWDENGNVGFAERRIVISTDRPDTAKVEELVDPLAKFGVSLAPAVVTHRHSGLLTLTVGPLRRAGATLYLEQWVDRNGNGVADSGEQIVRVFKLVDGLASPSSRVPGDTDGRADRMITTRLSLDQLHDGSPGPVQYVLLAMGDSNVAETVFRVVPEP